MKLTKRYAESLKKYDIKQAYESEEAMKLAVETATAKFDETIELHVRLGVDVRHADQQVRGVCVLPNGTGKSIKVLVIAKGLKADEARAAGADFVGDDDMVAKIQGGWFGFDVCVTTPDMMGVVGRLGKVLGPKGLMPNPKSGTVTMDLTKALADIKAGTHRKEVFRSGKAHGELHHRYGRYSQGETCGCERHLHQERFRQQYDGPRRKSKLSCVICLTNTNRYNKIYR